MLVQDIQLVRTKFQPDRLHCLHFLVAQPFKQQLVIAFLIACVLIEDIELPIKSAQDETLVELPNNLDSTQTLLLRLLEKHTVLLRIPLFVQLSVDFRKSLFLEIYWSFVSLLDDFLLNL